jgi:uroporphyrinogen decarboxylase
MNLTHSERVRKCINSEKVDHPPVALWRHFPVDDQGPETLAEATLNFQVNYDFDIVKVTPASSFCLKDWGIEDKWMGSTEGTRTYTKRIISAPQDWERLRLLDPSAPHLAAQLFCLKLIRSALTQDTPILQTIFSPLAQARNLAGNETLISHLRLYPDAVMKGLHTIAEGTRRFVESAIGFGIDGIFYAVQHAQASLLSIEEYKSMGLQHDLHVLEPAAELWCNMLHLHGHDIYFSLVDSFNFQIVNWHDRETSPTLAEAQKYFKGAVCGGMRQETLAMDDQMEVRKEAQDALAQTKGGRIILGTGCVVSIIASHGNIMAARRSVDPSFAVRAGREVKR